jgi:hypothetical protein
MRPRGRSAEARRHRASRHCDCLERRERVMVGFDFGAGHSCFSPSACSGEVDTGSPIRTCAKQESTAISDRVVGQTRFNPIGNGCGCAF